MTQAEAALAGKVTPQITAVAESERVDAVTLMSVVASGRIVVPHNRNRDLRYPKGIGAGLRVKVNANIGTSADFPDTEPELEKLQAAVEAGADTVMDLSTGGDIREIRQAILELSLIHISEPTRPY
mgnify:CR=1 FL=1